MLMRQTNCVPVGPAGMYIISPGGIIQAGELIIFSAVHELTLVVHNQSRGHSTYFIIQKDCKREKGEMYSNV